MSMPEDERAAAIQRIGAWYGTQAGAGRIVEGRRLAGRDSARTVRLGQAGRSGTPAHTDGPFAETNEAIGSYAIVEAPTMEEAVAVAESWPGGGGVEVRPLMED
jgi:hypothetical protein